MKHYSAFSSHGILWKVIICYLLPIILIGSYAVLKPDTSQWQILSAGLLLTMIGSLFIFWMMTRHIRLFLTPQESPSKQNEQNSVPVNIIDRTEELTHALERCKDLQEQFDILLIERQQLVHEIEKHTEEGKRVFDELEEYRTLTSGQLEQQQIFIRELQNTIAEQKNMMEKRQQQIGQLDSKVGDLTYEIKTLLKLAETHSGSLYSDAPEENSTTTPLTQKTPRIEELHRPYKEKRINSAEEASQQLKRCLDISQKITGSYRFNSHPNGLSDSSTDSYSFDLRRLCDSLRSETGGAIILYSPKDNQLLFVNQYIKTLTGWSPEKFIQNFIEILDDVNAWKQGIANLAIRNEMQTKFNLKSRSGEDILVNAHMGFIPTGIFRQHLIAVLYSPLESSTGAL